MEDFISQQAASISKPVAQDITVNGQTGVAYFKPLTAYQKQQLVKGKKYPYRTRQESAANDDDSDPEKKPEALEQVIEIDLEDNEVNQHKVVQFCTCKEDGAQRFKNLTEVQSLPGVLVKALYKGAQAVNLLAENGAKEGEPAGES